MPAPVTGSPRIAELTRTGDVAGFWSEVTRTPLVEPDGVLTFLWRDDCAGSVLLLVNKLFDRHDPDASLMRRVPGTDVWHLSYRLPADWRGSYQIAPGADPRQAVPDPLNPLTLPQRHGAPHKSVAEMPDAPAQDHVLPREGVPAGEIVEERWHDRRVWIHTPPGPAPAARYPLLVLLDGDIWGETLPIFPTLDNLIAEGRIPPMVTVLPDAGDRSVEFTCQEEFADALADLVPWTARRRPVALDPARTIIAGQSLGGLAATFAAHRTPQRFGNVITQSGSFWWRSGTPYDAGAEWLTHRLATTARVPLRFYVEVGRDEWVGLPPNRHLRDVLLAKGYDVTYREFSGGHDQACWRGGLATALEVITRDW